MGLACCKSDTVEHRLDGRDEELPKNDESEFLNTLQVLTEKEPAAQLDENFPQEREPRETSVKPLEAQTEEVRVEAIEDTLEQKAPTEEVPKDADDKNEQEVEQLETVVTSPLLQESKDETDDPAKADELAAELAAENGHKQKSEEAKKKQTTEEAKKKAADAKKKAVEEEAKRKAEEEARKRALEEQMKREKIQKAKARKLAWKSYDKKKQSDMIHRLCKAAVAGDTSILLQLLDESVDLDVFGPDGEYMTALHCACNAGQAEFAKVLIENGADPCGTIKASANTPLHLAAKRNDADCCEIVGLPKALTMKNGQGQTPKDVAEAAGAKAALKALKKVAKKV